MKFDINSRWTQKVLFTAEIDCDETTSFRLKTGLAVKWAVKTGADLTSADLTGADLTGAVLRSAVLTGADLTGAVLRDAVLTGALLRDVPIIPNIHGAVYAAAMVNNALNMNDWHTEMVCRTAHCWAGWVTTLAGEPGKALEKLIGCPSAATLIYLASDPGLERIPDFYTDSETALADMKRLAEMETGE